MLIVVPVNIFFYENGDYQEILILKFLAVMTNNMALAILK